MLNTLLLLLGIGCITKDVDNCCDALAEVFEEEFEEIFEEDYEWQQRKIINTNKKIFLIAFMVPFINMLVYLTEYTIVFLKDPEQYSIYTNS